MKIGKGKPPTNDGSEHGKSTEFSNAVRAMKPGDWVELSDECRSGLYQRAAMAMVGSAFSVRTSANKGKVVLVRNRHPLLDGNK